MWLARSFNGELRLFAEEPEWIDGTWRYAVWYYPYCPKDPEDVEYEGDEKELYNWGTVIGGENDYPEITWENSPKKVKNIKIELE